MTITSVHDKIISNQILVMDGITFYGIFLALCARASSVEFEKLESVFPEAVTEARIRYHAPDGCLNASEWLHKNKNDEAARNVDMVVLEKLFKQAYIKASMR
jgi:hypothetical protein